MKRKEFLNGRCRTIHLSIRAMLVSLLLITFVPSGRAQQSPPLVIVHAVIIDGNGNPPVEDGTIIVQSDRIVSVGPAGDAKIPPQARIIDARGRAVMPGIADMHVHLVGGWDGVSTDILGYQRYLNSLLYAGVTSVLDVGNVHPFVLQLRQELAAGRLTGPRIFCAGALLDGPDPLWPAISYSVFSAQQVPGFVQQLKSDGVDLIKAYVGLSDQVVRALTAQAKKNSLRVIIDQGSRNGSMDLMREGISAFAHLPTMRMSDEAIALMKEKGIFCLSTLSVFESFSRRRLADLNFLDNPLIKDTTPPWFLGDLKKEASRELKEQEKSMQQRMSQAFEEAKMNAKKLHGAGILMAAGTDAPYPGVFQGEGIHRELELLVESGLTPLEAIRAATKNASLVIDAASDWGTIEPGKIATILIVAGRPDKNIADTRRIETVILSGKLIDREKLRFDQNKDLGFRTFSPGAWKK